MSGYNQLTPTSGIPWWEKQPNESANSYSRFVAYRELPPGKRSYKVLSESVNAKVATLRQQGTAYKWADRAAAWDEEQARIRREQMAAQVLRLSRAHMSISLKATEVLGRSIKDIAESGEPLPPELMPRWASMIETLRRMALDSPDFTLSEDNGIADGAQLAEFQGLSASERRNRAREMAEGVLRLYPGGRSA